MSHIHASARVHPTAYVDPSAKIGAKVIVNPYCKVGPNVTIGDGTVLDCHVTIQSNTIIGRDNRISTFAVIGTDEQDRKSTGEESWLVIGDKNKIREYVVIQRGSKSEKKETRIGSNNVFMVSTNISHDCVVGNDVSLTNQVTLSPQVHVMDGANIGGGARIHNKVTIGTLAFVGGLGTVTKDVPPFMTVEGNPAHVRTINSLALVRKGFEVAHIEAVKTAYKLLFRSEGPSVTEKIMELKSRFANMPAVLILCAALEASDAGFHGRALDRRTA